MLMLVCRLGALRQIRWKLRGSALDRTFLVLFGAPGVPHGDTLNLAFQNLRPDDLQEVVCSMLETLIRKKVLYPFRLLDRWFTVALDATGCVTFHERHCDHCLTRKSGSTILYYHNVLEAKLVARTGLALRRRASSNASPACRSACSWTASTPAGRPSRFVKPWGGSSSSRSRTAACPRCMRNFTD